MDGMLLAAGVLALLPAPAEPQLGVRVEPRVLADLGRPGFDVTETALAAGATRRLSVYWTRFGQQGDLRAAVGSGDPPEWRAGDVRPAGQGFPADDPTLAVLDAGADRFALLARTVTALKACTFSPASGFSAWQTIATGSGVSSSIDKPWIVRRAPDEFLVFWTRLDRYEYLRSADGATWPGPPIPVTAEIPVVGVPFCHPAVAADGRVFLAHATAAFGADGDGRIRFLVGREGPAGLVFRYLRTPDGGFVEYVPRLSQAQGLPVPVANPREPYKSSLVPEIACDPTDPRRFWMVVRDTADDDPLDVDVHLLRIEQGPGDAWGIVSNLPVHDEATLPDGSRSDQYGCVMAVDSRGRVHVLYFDNRPACGEAGDGTGFDAWYAISRNHGATFQRFNLRADCSEPRPVDLSLRGNAVGATWSTREYSGIALQEVEGATWVWLAYPGTSLQDPDPLRKSVVWTQRVVVSDG